MKIKSSQKTLGMILLTIAMTFGCASQQKQEPAPAAKGPSAAETAIAEAEAAIKKAKSLDWIWRDTEKDLKKAKEALAKGDEEKAIKLANTARDQAELAVKQYYYEQGVDRAMPPMDTSSTDYSVLQGDSLWKISGKSEVYSNPYQWPLIYKANSDKIKDADLIYPGQVFSINTTPSDAEISAAVNHAKTRGAWSIGVVEESDKAYLAK
jgi:nucleoid-associated protein YgaU